ncbi:MAG: ribonuclease E/G, partial [Rhodospirillales bacterium]|nr:ribonuclease E/G [Rhodospirillales bacterium]
MPKRMLIDAARPEETRVVVADGAQLEDYDVALASRPQIRGNIYLAKVVRVEASLQAAFVDYGHEKHGFLSFTEIHPDYFQIPVADREAIVARDSELARQEAEADELDDDDPEDLDAADTGEELSADSGEDDEDQIAEGDNRSERPRRR